MIDYAQFSMDIEKRFKIRNIFPDDGKLRNQELYFMKHSRYLTREVLDEIQKSVLEGVGVREEKADAVYIKMEDYLENFTDEIAVCFYHDSYWLSSRVDYILDDARNLHDLAFFEFKPNKEGSYYFGVSQPEVEKYRFLKISIFEVRYKFGRISKRKKLIFSKVVLCMPVDTRNQKEMYGAGKL